MHNKIVMKMVSLWGWDVVHLSDIVYHNCLIIGVGFFREVPQPPFNLPWYNSMLYRYFRIIATLLLIIISHQMTITKLIVQRRWLSKIVSFYSVILTIRSTFGETWIFKSIWKVRTILSLSLTIFFFDYTVVNNQVPLSSVAKAYTI